MNEPEIQVIDNPEKEQIRCVERALGRYNEGFTGKEVSRRYAVLARDSAGQVVGGLIAWISWGWCYIETLWLAEELRGRGVGRRLLEAGERHAVELGADKAYLWTASFQSPKFYLANGYTVFGQLEDCPPGHIKFYLRKTLKK